MADSGWALERLVRVDAERWWFTGSVVYLPDAGATRRPTICCWWDAKKES